MERRNELLSHKKQVETANRLEICCWYRFLRSPETPEQIEVMNCIVERVKEFGGFTPEISKWVGWQPGSNRT